MKKTGLFAALAAALLFTGCFHKIHELEPSKYGDLAAGYLGTSLQWEQADDAGTAVRSLSLSVGGRGASFSRNYKSAVEAAEEVLQLPTGPCDVLARVNMGDDDGFAIAGMPATKNELAEGLGDVIVSLKNPVSSPEQAWFGVEHTYIKNKEIVIVQAGLQRLLSSFSVKVDDVPAGTKLVFTLSNVAKNVNLTARDANGRYGLPGKQSVGDLVIATLTAASDGPLGVEGFKVMPTASAFTRCILTVNVTPPSGNLETYVCDAPLMEAGKGYSLNLNYGTLEPYMYINSSSISAWEDGWTVNGEILNPQE